MESRSVSAIESINQHLDESQQTLKSNSSTVDKKKSYKLKKQVSKTRTQAVKIGS